MRARADVVSRNPVPSRNSACPGLMDSDMARNLGQGIGTAPIGISDRTVLIVNRLSDLRQTPSRAQFFRNLAAKFLSLEFLEHRFDK